MSSWTATCSSRRRPILSRTGTFDSKSQNHELQFISPTEQWLDGRLDLVAGLYYFHEKYSQGETLHMNAQFCNIAPAPAVGLCNAFLAANGGTKEDATVQDVNQKVDSYAAYAQANFHFTDQLFATVGGRFSKDKKEGVYDQPTNPFLADVRAAEAPDASRTSMTSGSPIASASTMSRTRTCCSSAPIRPATSRPATIAAPARRR